MRHVPLQEDPHVAVSEDGRVQDFAFADTVVAGLEEPAPSSEVILGRSGSTHCLTPISQPTLPADTPTGIRHRQLAVVARVRDAIRASRAEMSELWSAAASVEDVDEAQARRADAGAPLARAAAVGRRVRTFISFFEWDRADLLRAASLGFVVFVLAAAAGAIALRARSPQGAPATTHADMSAP
jgi:hypothetical protein